MRPTRGRRGGRGGHAALRKHQPSSNKGMFLLSVWKWGADQRQQNRRWRERLRPAALLIEDAGRGRDGPAWQRLQSVLHEQDLHRATPASRLSLCLTVMNVKQYLWISNLINTKAAEGRSNWKLCLYDSWGGGGGRFPVTGASQRQ